MAEDTGQERTEQPTEKRLRETREKGQVPRSKELNSMALLMTASGAALIFGDNMLAGISDSMRHGLSIKQAGLLSHQDIIDRLSDTAFSGLTAVAPMLLILVVAALLTPIGLGGWSFSMKAVSFKLEKINPIKGFGRMFSLRGLMELFKVLGKFILVASISAGIIWSLMGDLLGLGDESIEAALPHVASLCGWTFLACSCGLIVIASIDAPFQLWQHNKQLRMTRQEVKDENKETDGRPEVKGKIRALQQEMSRKRMMEQVPTADVVITNPTHYAVALRYDQNSMQAPVVVAKGADLIAAQIRQIATDNDVALVEAPPLARALYATTEIDQAIPAGLYVAVATILTYVYQLQAGDHYGEAPELPDELPIPDDLRDVLNDDEEKNQGSVLRDDVR